MQEIQDLKLQGYTKADIIRYYEAQGRKPPSRPTLSKYYDMDVIPDDPGAKLAKPKTFDVEPFRARSSGSLRRTVGKVSVCHLFTMSWKKNSSKMETMKTSRQPADAPQLYPLSRGFRQINREPEHRRIYDYVFDTPPGEQMLIDFGEQTLSKTKSIHFIRLLLRYSRFLCVYAQDHKYNSEEACKAIYHSFCRLEDVLKSWSSTRTPCLSPVKPMAKSSRP